MKTLTEEEFKRKYGTIGVTKFKDAEKEESMFDSLKSQISEAFEGGLSQVQQGVDEGQTNTNPLQQLESGAKVGAGVVNTAFSPLAPIGNAINKYVVKPASDFISGSKKVQDFADSRAGETTARVAEDVGNLSTIAGGALGPKAGARVAEGAIKGTGKAIESLPKPPPGGGAAGSYVGGAMRDMIPTKQNLIDESVAKAFDLTSQDLVKLAPRTGYSVTQWLSDNNLIGKDRAQTEGMVKGFFAQNYKEVRSEIAKVKNEYKMASLPRYFDALKQIQSKVEGVPGLEKIAVEVENLMNKKNPILSDVQRAKELLDEHFSLYKRTGDVAEGVQKQGIANMRNELQTFIENEVQKNTGADIRNMNQNVSTARGLSDAIENRSTLGVTRNMISTRDAMIGFGLFAGINPLVGAAYIFMQKLINAPSARLKFARWLDSIGDKQKKIVNDALLEGKVPKEAQLAIEAST